MSSSDEELSIARNKSRARMIIKIVLVVSVIGHTMQALNYHATGHPSLALIHVMSLGLLAITWWLLLSRDAVKTAWWVMIFEMVSVGLTETLLLGIIPGFMIFPLIGTGIATAIPFDSERRRFLVLCVVMIISILTLLAVYAEGPQMILPTDELTNILVKNLLIMGIGVSIVLWLFTKAMARTEDALASEFARSEGLLQNMLPVSVADRLKSGTGLIADHHADATVLFADIAGFTERSTRYPAEDLVTMLKDIFARFDALTTRDGVEKVKTIGDAYMVVIGVTEDCADQAITAVNLARDMMEAVGDINTPDGQPITLRIGIHSGPVIAGVIGEKRMAFDLWGDTVNTASRMESTGVVGRIQVSEAIKSRLPETVSVEFRGPTQIKGKGEMNTWLVA